MNKGEKMQLILDYIFGSGSKAERKEKLEIAWDVRETFDDIKKEIRKKVIEFLCEEIKKNPEFKGYKITDFGLIKGISHETLNIYKPEWLLKYDDGKGILEYAIEKERKSKKLYYGITKFNDDEEVPFKGKWEEAKIPEEWKRIFENIFTRMKESLVESLESNTWWPLQIKFDEPYDGMWERKFYEKIFDESNSSIEDGCRKVAKYYVEKLLDLKRKTENLIDEFIEIYKKSRR